VTGWFVTANDIKTWTASDKRRAEEVLPLLVKKLVYASCKPKEIDFSSGDAVAIGGWDGILDVKEGNEFVPEGKSGWELGTSYNVKNKADGDYDKRTRKPHPLALHESTFVFVTSRPRTKRDSWVNEKRALGTWKHVKGINAYTLESWLACCPAVHRWFAGVLGKRTGDLWDIEQAWAVLSNVTKVSLTPHMFVNSREMERDRLLRELTGKASILRVKAQSKMEAYGFILGSLMSQEQYSAKVLIVKNQTAWDWLIDFYRPLILVPDGFPPTGIGGAVSKGHHVVLAIDRLDTASADIFLNRMSRQERIAAVKSIGLTDDKAAQVYSDTKGYLEPILRHDALSPQDKFLPRWANSADSAILFAALFATEWNTDNDHDKAVMSSLAGKEYQGFEKHIVGVSKEPDPPIRLVRNVWQVISKMDMWLHVAPHIAKTHLDRLGVAVKLVLSDLDPSFDLPSDERYMANVTGAIPLYSAGIKSGIADSLALLSVYGDEYADQVGSEKLSDIVSWWVRQVFEDSVEAKVWYSLGRCLESLAEASPDEFLRALERAISGEGAPIKGLLLAEGDAPFGGCPHSDLLWSLELVSWDKSHLARVSACLARLSEIDPGGKYSNRPFSSLVDIFLGWINNTQASHEQRLQVIEDVLVTQFSDIAWKLMLSLLINKTRTTSGINKPQYREWAEGVDRTVMQHQYYEYVGKIVDVLFREVDQNFEERLPDLVDNFSSYNKEQRKSLIDRLIGVDIHAWKPEGRANIVNRLRKHLSHHREFPDAGWSWPEELLGELEKVYDKFEFNDVVKKNMHLFNNHWPDLIEPIKRKEVDYDERARIIATKRIKAVEAICTIGGVERIAELAGQCHYPGIIGPALFRSQYCEKAVPHIVAWLGADERLDSVAQSYISARSVESLDWAKTLLDSGHLDPIKKVSLLWGLPIQATTFDLVERQDEDVRRKYWSGLRHSFLLPKDRDKAGYVASKLLQYDRPLAAVDALAQSLRSKSNIKKVDSRFVAGILMRIATDPTDIERVSIQDVRYDILKAIEFVQDRADLAVEELAQIEWAYVKIFRFESVRPRYLFQKVSSDPSFFVQLITWVFRRDEGADLKEDVSEEIAKQRAEIAWELLETVSVLPGSDGGAIDSDRLNMWVGQAREMLKRAGRLRVGDNEIGSYLSRCAEGSDGIWPHEAVRSVIEAVRSVEMDEGIHVGRMNSRGTTSRSPFDGGEQERLLAAKYTTDAQKIELSYPRTADILRGLARSYERDASREDQEVELRG